MAIFFRHPRYRLASMNEGRGAMSKDNSRARSADVHDSCQAAPAASRRGLLAAGAVLAGGAMAQLFTTGAVAAGANATLERLKSAERDPAHRVLLKGGMVLSLDPKVGDFAHGDVLIEGKKILAVGRNLGTAALVVDAAGMIIMPGFVDTHHHQYETILRGILADGVLGSPGDGKKTYQGVIQGVFTPVYQPEDAYISELVASLNQLNAGVTTTVDTSQVSHTPDHSDACIAGLKESGRRAVYTYSPGLGPGTQYPKDLLRLQSQYFSSTDQLLTLELNAAPKAENWQLARQAGVPIICHIVGDRSGSFEAIGKAGLMGPDNEYIHCTQLNETHWKMIADTGGKISIAPAIEMQMGHGMPPLQTSIDHGIQPSLSVDVECNMTADMFTVMRTTFTLQRALINERSLAGEENLPSLLGCRDVIEMATIAGARAAHLDHKIGTLSPGKEADIIMLAGDRINVFPLNNVPGTVVTLMDTSNVDSVFVAGKVVKWQGRLVGVDLGRLRRMVEKSRDGVLASAGYAADLFGTCCRA
jgi:5-methylthioadenosine/S-adenosylhomocysteine deaminase